MSWVPSGICFLARAGIELSIQCARGVALILFSVLAGGVELFILQSLQSGTQQGRVVRKGRLVKVELLKLLLHKELVSSSSHASLPG